MRKSHYFFVLMGTFLFSFHGLFSQSETKLPPPQLGGGGLYGKDVGLDSSMLIAGGGPGLVAPFTLHTQATVFERISNNWELSGRLTPSDSATYGEQFGFSAAISAGATNIAVVGAPDDGEAGTKSGAVYIFERGASNPWVQAAKFSGSDPMNGAFLGGAVGVSGNYAIAGAPEYNVSPMPLNAEDGKAYIFKRDSISGIWAEDAPLIASDFRPDAHFGQSVSIDPPYAIVGSPFADSIGGAAYIYECVGTTWTEVAKLKPATFVGLGVLDEFGWSVDISGDRAVVGAWFVTTGSNPHGGAYVFDKTPNGWEETALIVPSDSQPSGGFGRDVAIDGDVIAVGADNTDINNVTPGSVYIYKFNGSKWVEQSPIIYPSDATETQLFGMSVDVWGDQAVVGSPGQNDSSAAAGMVYHYDGICTGGVGIEDLFDYPELGNFLYPNPASGEVYLSEIEGTPGSSLVSVYDLQGRAVLTSTLHFRESNINVRNLVPGRYMVRQRFEKGEARVQKLVVE